MLMDSKKIDEMLARYWNCESSVEEEHALRQYFQSAHVSEHHQEAAALFRYFEEQKKKSFSDSSFDGRILKRVKTSGGKLVSIFYNSMRIAAGISVLVMAIWFVRTELRKSGSTDVTDTYSDPKVAFEETKKALLIISKSFGKAEEEAKKINLFNEAQQEIQQQKETNIQL
jgi:hypothetical protein